MSEKNRYPVGRIRFLWMNLRGVRLMFILSLVGTVIYSGLQLVIPYFTSQITDTFLSGEQAAYNLANRQPLFWQQIGTMVGLTIFRVTVVYFCCCGMERGSQMALYNIRNTMYDKVQRQDMAFYATYRTGDLMTRFTGDLGAVQHMIAWVCRSIVECFSLFTATAVYFLIMNWRLALCSLAMAPVIFMIIYRFRARVRPMHKLLREKFAGMNTDAQENISGNRVVKAFAREDFEIEKFDRTNRDYAETSQKTAMTWQHYFPLVETCADILPVILMIVGGLFMISDDPAIHLTMGEYVAFSGLVWAVCMPMRQLGNIFNEFQRFTAAVDKVMEVWYAEPGIRDAEDAVEHEGRFEGKIEFDHVSFSYPDGQFPVLRDVSFTAEPGQTVAIMGETGCGKSSLINLIPRFFDPTQGEVRLDGIPVNRLKLKELRKGIGMATQDVLLYSDTIEDNIAYGDTSLQSREVEKFAQLSAASRFINHLPERYHTIVGERGVGLSGGQKQRISLARALAVRPSVLILDDTTSAVDMETEKEIQDHLKELDFSCTKLIIAQRISTTRSADKILVLQDGRISEEGTHEQLIAKKGYYYELVKLQTGLDQELEELIRRTAGKEA